MTPREQIEALAAEMESGWGAAQTSLASFALDTAARLRAVLASWTPPDEKLVSPGASSPPVPAPTKGAAAGCDESVRETWPCAVCGEPIPFGPGCWHLACRASQGGERPRDP
jgi:hypothetical protein